MKGKQPGRPALVMIWYYVDQWADTFAVSDDGEKFILEVTDYKGFCDLGQKIKELIMQNRE